MTDQPPVVVNPEAVGDPNQTPIVRLWPDERTTRWGHWDNPVIYMSRATAREVWVMFYGTEPDLSGDLRFGQTQIPVLFDDRMALGEARLEEDPDQPTGE